MSDDAWIACGAVAALPVPHVPSVIRWCEECAEPVWLSHHARERVARMGHPLARVHVACLSCYVALMDANPEWRMATGIERRMAADIRTWVERCPSPSAGGTAARCGMFSGTCQLGECSRPDAR